MLAKEISKARLRPPVVVEGTYGCNWVADVLQATVAEMHLALSLGVKGAPPIVG
jgi:hypothetical protein